MDTFTYYLPCFYAFFACIGFSLLFNIHGAAGMLICAGGGGLGWLVYLLTAPLVHSDIIQAFSPPWPFPPGRRSWPGCVSAR